MIEKNRAIEIIENILDRESEKRIFKIPLYKGIKKVIGSIILLQKKIMYKKLFLNDYEHIGHIIAYDDFKEEKEKLHILEVFEFDKVFIFSLGTEIYKFNRQRYFGLMDEKEKPIFLNRKNGKTYRFLSNLPNIDWYVELFSSHKDEDREKEFINVFKEIKKFNEMV